MRDRLYTFSEKNKLMQKKPNYVCGVLLLPSYAK